jgi:leader peptidase (prepilin peptidase)/N-methyltransferase
MIRIYVTLFAALAGLAFGSFLNVCLTRWPAGESIVKPRSHCRSCERTLAWWENIPLVSWLALRGRCRTCGVWISFRHPLVELAVGGLWAAVGWRLVSQIQDAQSAAATQSSSFGFGLLGAIGLLLFSWMLVGLAILDAEHLWLADAVTLPGIALGIVYFAWVDDFTATGSALTFDFWVSIAKRLGAAALAALLILLIRWTYKLVRKREGIGLGDAKLMAMLAAWLGLPGALLSFAIGVMLGALTALVLLALPSTRAKETPAGERNRDAASSGAPSWALRKLPLGTFLCIGGIVSALWGQPILAAYLRWAGF